MADHSYGLLDCAAVRRVVEDIDDLERHVRGGPADREQEVGGGEFRAARLVPPPDAVVHGQLLVERLNHLAASVIYTATSSDRGSLEWVAALGRVDGLRIELTLRVARAQRIEPLVAALARSGCLTNKSTRKPRWR